MQRLLHHRVGGRLPGQLIRLVRDGMIKSHSSRMRSRQRVQFPVFALDTSDNLAMRRCHVVQWDERETRFGNQSLDCGGWPADDAFFRRVDRQQETMT